jgi:hypothetical protein
MAAIGELATYSPEIEAFLQSSEYVLRNPPAIANFLEANPFLLHFLREAHTEIRKIFSIEELTLQFQRDSEGEEYDHLLLRIWSNEGADIAGKKRKTLVNNWWLDKISKVEDKLMITLDFK